MKTYHKVWRVIIFFFRNLSTCFKILFKYKHFFVVSLDKKDFIKFLSDDKNLSYKMRWSGMREFQMKLSIRIMSDSFDDIELALEKGTFEAEVIETLENNKK